MKNITVSVGGHCIGVAPYYRTHEAESVGYSHQVIPAGRRINDSMGKFIAQRTVKEMIKAGHSIKGATVTVLGLTFKENCPDLRNSKVIDIIRELQDYGINVQVTDPQADPAEAVHEYGVTLTPFNKLKKANAVVLAVAHKECARLQPKDLVKLMFRKPVVVDIKGQLKREFLEKSGISLWRL